MVLDSVKEEIEVPRTLLRNLSIKRNVKGEQSFYETPRVGAHVLKRKKMKSRNLRVFTSFPTLKKDREL